MQRRVVAVAGPVGAGKTSLVRGLQARLPDAEAVFLDHWETFTQRPLEELEDWIRAGAEIDASKEGSVDW